MRKVLKKVTGVHTLLMLLLLCMLTGCSQYQTMPVQETAALDAAETEETAETTEAAETEEADAETEAEAKDLVILYTNDVHCGIDNELGYAQLAAYKKQQLDEGKDVLIADAGDYVQGAPIGTVSKGTYMLDIMNALPYDVATVGNHEFDYGMSQFKTYINKAAFPIVCCNLIEEGTGETMLPPYQMFSFTDKKVAFLGVTTPKTLSSSNPSSFKNKAGEQIYSFCEDETGEKLYKQVQAGVDAARADGADYVILLAHLGVDASTTPWMSTEVIANTTGIDAVLDGHSHSVVEGEQVKNKEGKTVLLTQTGTQFANFGALTISKNGVLHSELISSFDDEDEEVKAFIENLKSDFQDEMDKKIGSSEVELVINDPETGERIIRNAETNAGDFCADAFRFVTGSEIAIANGGGIRNSVPKGEVTYGDVINLYPYENTVSVIEVTGQQLLDALELGVSELPAENGGFLQVSGMSYEIDMSVPSTVERNNAGEFLKVGGAYRVKNVQIGGKPIELERVYVLSGIDYILRDGGDGFTMFKDAKRINESFILDSEVIVEYITDGLNGRIGKSYSQPYGEERIVEYKE